MSHSVYWMSWKDETCQKSLAEEKPILLYLTAHWGNWCHVMEQTTFRDRQIIDDINQYFIPVKVNIDQFPHIGDRYHQGGYPSVVFLTGMGEIVRGYNYLTPAQMKEAFETVLNKYALIDTTKGYSVNDTFVAKKRTMSRFPRVKQIENILAVICEAFDQQYGGFCQYQGQPKFLYPEINDFLLTYFQYKKDETVRCMLIKTLDGILNGEISDKTDGGFFRLARNPDWSDPCSEKTLENNAGLLVNFLRAYQIWRLDRYRVAAKNILGFLEGTLFNADYNLFGGSMRHNSICTIPYTNWNGLTASGLILAGKVLQKKYYLNFALEVINRLWDDFFRADKGITHFKIIRESEVEVLSDQVYVAEALIKAFNETGNHVYLTKAKTLVDQMIEYYFHPGKGFSDIPSYTAKIGYLNIPYYPVLENARAVKVLLSMATLGNDKKYEKLVNDTLATVLNYGDCPVIAAGAGLALFDLHTYERSLTLAKI